MLVETEDELLARLVAVSEAERSSPDAQRLTRALKCLEEIQGLLPLPGEGGAEGSPTDAGSGSPGGGAGSPGRRRLLLAMALAARADYLCPHSPLHLFQVRERLSTYLCCLPTAEGALRAARSGNSGGGSRSRSGSMHASKEQGASVLLLYSVAACADPVAEGLEVVRAASKAAASLSNPACQAAVGRLLQQLAAASSSSGGGRFALTPQQLQHACWCRLAEAGSKLLTNHHRPSVLLHTGSVHSMWLPAPQLAEVQAAVASAAAGLLQLERDSPKGLLAAGAAYASLRQPRLAGQVYLRAMRTASQQKDAYWGVRAAAHVMSASCTKPHHLTSMAVQTALAVLQQTAPTMEHTTAVLPESWSRRLRADVSHALRRLATTQAQLQAQLELLELQQPGGEGQQQQEAQGQGQQRQQQQQQRLKVQQQQQQAAPDGVGKVRNGEWAAAAAAAADQPKSLLPDLRPAPPPALAKRLHLLAHHNGVHCCAAKGPCCCAKCKLLAHHLSIDGDILCSPQQPFTPAANMESPPVPAHAQAGP